MKNDAQPLSGIALIALALAGAPQAWSNPAAPTVVSGSATFATSGNTLTITNSSSTVINWQGFSIAPGETTNFVQPSSISAVLNRVTTQSPSAILGGLQSNGKVFLINPNGVLFGAGAQVSAASFIASTINVADSAFLAGTANFQIGAGSTISFDGSVNFSAPANMNSTEVTVSGVDIMSANNLQLSASGNISIMSGNGGNAGGVSVAGAGVTIASAGAPIVTTSPNVTAPLGGAVTSGGMESRASTAASTAAAPGAPGRVASISVNLQKREPLF